LNPHHLCPPAASPAAAAAAPLQLALVLLLQGLLPGLSHPPLLYDPAFSEADALLLPLLGLEVIKENEEGRRAVTGPTLFYLPHCEVGGWLMWLAG
jgi:hypothetical protein